VDKALQIVPSISVKPAKEVEPGYLLGTMFIEGVEHHLELIEVVEDSQTGEQQVPNKGNFDQWALNRQRYDEMQAAYDGIYYPVEFDGRTFVCRVHPYCK
jgi:hypothetical protein